MGIGFSSLYVLCIDEKGYFFLFGMVVGIVSICIVDCK